MSTISVSSSTQTISVDAATQSVSVILSGPQGPAGEGGEGGGADTLDELTDVVITAAASGDILRHNGTNWVDTPGTDHYETAGAVATHSADTTNVHGIADTSALETTTGAQAKADAAEAAAEATAAAALSAHEAAANPHPTYLTAAEGNAAYDAIGAAAAAQAASQPLDSDLTAIAALTTTAYGRALLALANQAALVALLPSYQPLDADLTALAAAGNSAVLAATTASFLTADETKLDGIEAGAEVNDSAAEILAKLVTVDGAGSGLDADTLDGSSSAAFAAAGHDHDADYAPINGDDEVYGAGWNGDLTYPTKNAVYDKVETLVSGGATNLDELSDVVITAAASGDIIRHNGTNWVDTPGTTHFEAAGAVAAHEADTTSVHGIADTSVLVTTTNTPADLAADTSTTQSGTTYSLAAADDGTSVVCSNASQVTVTIPTNATTALRVGYRVMLVSSGAGGLTLSTTGITLVGSSPNTTVAQNEGLYLEKTATDTWIVLGGTSA